ncbi:MAG: hypothetical protein IPG45_11705 [Deltaproteobacteria bacterium]|nr:hypothetical protein [Deltaproteobacteria bacterium]
MVKQGQYLERAVVIPGASALEGLYHRGSRRPGLVIAPPHPQDGGAMETTVVAELAYAAFRAGHPTLRFNYPGVGASPGVFDEGLEVGMRALRQSLDHLGESLGERPELSALGIGYGATLVARAALEGALDPVFLVSPDPDALPELSPIRAPVVIVVGQMDPRANRQTLEARLRGVPQGRLVVIPQADRTFLRGLLELGKVVAETLSPPGMIEIL